MTCETDSFADDLAELASAEEFLDYFGVVYDARVVQVNRLHILQRYHDYLAAQEAGKSPEYAAYRAWLLRAYQDFVGSSAQREKVFAVFRRAEGIAFVPLSSLTFMQQAPPTDGETRERQIEGPPPPSPPQGGATNQLASLDYHPSLRTSCFTLAG